MHAIVRVLATAVFALCGPALTAAQAEEARRVALVIASQGYEALRPLKTPLRDALSVDRLLGDLGFDVRLELDRDLAGLRAAVTAFAAEAKGAELALVYYAGHGVEIGGENLILPVDALATGAEALRAGALPLEEVVAEVRAVVPAAVVIVDACREDPFGTAPPVDRIAGPRSRGARPLEVPLPGGINGGFARVGRADGMLFAFSTSPSSLASDGEGENSPFAAALLRHLPVAGQALPVALTLVQQDVYDRSGGWQLPYVETALPDLIFLAGEPPPPDERDRLLLQMAGVSPAVRAEVEAVAARTGAPLAPLYAALLAADPGAGPEDQRALLERAAAQYIEFRREVERMQTGDAEIVALQEGALEDYALGALDAAEAKLAEAKRRGQDAVARAQDRLGTEVAGLAQSYLLSARMADARGDVEQAFADLEAADALFRQSGGQAFAPRHREVWADVLMAHADLWADRGWGEPDLNMAHALLVGLSEEDPGNWQVAAKRVVIEGRMILMSHAAWEDALIDAPDMVETMARAVDLAKTAPRTAEGLSLLSDVYASLSGALASAGREAEDVADQLRVLAADAQGRAADLDPSDAEAALKAVRRYLDVASLATTALAAPANQAALDRLAPLMVPRAYPGAEELWAVAQFLAASNLSRTLREERDYLSRSLALLLRLQAEGRWPSIYLRTIDVTRALCEVMAADLLDRPRAPCTP